MSQNFSIENWLSYPLKTHISLVAIQEKQHSERDRFGVSSLFSFSDYKDIR